MSDDTEADIVLQLDALATYAERANHWTDDKRLMDAAGVADTVFGAIHHIEELEAENEKLRKGLEIYERERNRFKHAKPEMTEEQYDEAMYELDDMFLAGEIGYADYIKGFRDLNEKYREGETND